MSTLTLPKSSPTLADYPELALAATNGSKAGALDINSEIFATVQGALETVCRLKLGARKAHLLTLLARSGTMPLGGLAKAMRISPGATTTQARSLELLGLITLSRRPEHGDARKVMAAITEAGRNVLANIVGLSALAGAASIMFRIPNPKH